MFARGKWIFQRHMESYNKRCQWSFIRPSSAPSMPIKYSHTFVSIHVHIFTCITYIYIHYLCTYINQGEIYAPVNMLVHSWIRQYVFCILKCSINPNVMEGKQYWWGYIELHAKINRLLITRRILNVEAVKIKWSITKTPPFGSYQAQTLHQQRPKHTWYSGYTHSLGGFS